AVRAPRDRLAPPRPAPRGRGPIATAAEFSLDGAASPGRRSVRSNGARCAGRSKSPLRSGPNHRQSSGQRRPRRGRRAAFAVPGAEGARVSQREVVKIGLLFSVTGPYRTIGRAMRNGALLAAEEINREPASPFGCATVGCDPAGDDRAYAVAARRMLADDGVVHVVGCYPSASRKEVLPFFEKHDGLLWYPSHYEGFESSEHVVYTGAAPNQHIVPLADYLLERCGVTAYFVGSNYIWAWENNKIMREAVQGAGGQVVAERYLPVGETDFGGIIRQILDSRPSFVFNTLIGDSAYAFFRAFRAAAAAQGIDQASAMPVASCSLAEPELVEIGAEAAAGHISSSVYFESVQTE